MLQGAKKSRIQVDDRLPITKSILFRLVLALNNTCAISYYQSLYKAMFVVAFYGLLRVGEITKKINDKDSHCLQYSDIAMQDQSFSINFRSHKYSIPGKVSRIFIHKLVHDPACTLFHLQNYFRMRGKDGGNLFQHPIGTPISRSQFTEILNTALCFIGLSPSLYKGHSFRIGACTWHMEQGCSDSQLCNMGRWRSNAFLKYIRP